MKYLTLAALLLAGCSSSYTSFDVRKPRSEYEINELKMEVADLKASLECYQTELGLDGDLLASPKRAAASTKDIQKKLTTLEKKIAQLESTVEKYLQELKTYTSVTSENLKEYATKITNLEKDVQVHHENFQEVAKLRGTMIQLSKTLTKAHQKTYKVRSGDTLEKIAKLHNTTAEDIKKINNLSSDLIVVGQDLVVNGS